MFIYGHADATALLLAHGSDANRQDRKGRSPAHCGCSKGQFETVKMIGGHGANLWLKNARGDLPLHEAAASGRRDLVKWLLTMRPSQVNARNNDGRCPLHLAALNDNADMCKILLDAGAQINPILRTSKNMFMTPLDCALRRGFRSTAKYLQLHGGVPAARLHNTQQQNVNSAVSLQIRDDITFWGDTSSDSERENGELNKHFIKIQKKKLAQKFKRKRSSASGGELEDRASGISEKHRSSRKHSVKSRLPKVRNDSASSGAPIPIKSSRSKFDYSNEIVINGNTEINIHQSRAISVGRENANVPIDQQIYEKLVSSQNIDAKSYKGMHKRPKSAKHSVKIKSNRSDSDRSSTAQSSCSDSSRRIKTEQRKQKLHGLKDQATNTIEKMKDRALSVQVAKTDAAVITDDFLLDSVREKINKPIFQSSRMSDTSEDQERQQNIIVEASIHEPPKTTNDGSVEHASANSKEKQDIRTNICDNVEEVTVGNFSEALEGSINISENQENLNNDELTPECAEKKPVDNFSNTEIEATDGRALIASQDEKSTQEQGEDANEGEIMEKQEEDTIETGEDIDKKLSIEGGEMNNEDETKSEHKDEIERNDEASEEDRNLEDHEISADENYSKKSISEKSKKLSNLKRILSHDTFLRNQEPSEDSTEINDAAREVAETAISLINLNIEQELSLQIHGLEQSELDKTELQEESNRSEYLSSNSDILNTGDTTVRQISEDHFRLTENNEKSIDGVEMRADDLMEKAFGETITEINQSIPETKMATTDKKIVRVQRRPRDSIMKTPTPPEDSSISSIAENKTHKSFTVLDEREPEETRAKRKSSKGKLKKQRSKSEENERKSGKGNRRPSKIPTPLGKSMLSKSERYLNHIDKENVELNHRIPSLPEMNNLKNSMNEPYRSQSTISNRRRVSIYSDEKGSASDDGGEKMRMPSRRRRTKKRSHRRDSRSAGSDYESSNVIDSGFEPSPRSVRVPKWKNVSERGVNMTTVTQSIQSNIRRYHLERKIFQHLLELKRMQIRSGQHNEATLVKRAIDAYHISCASTVGAGRYNSRDLSFKNFEKFLYESLRKLQKNDVEYLRGLPEAPNNPLLCTRSTHRCMHATHAYTGVPCAAYLPKLDHHTIPKIGFNDCKPGTGGFLPNINPKKSVTLELCHGNDKQIISLPAERLDQNKRYYVTFTVKGTENDAAINDTIVPVDAHRHSRSE